MYILNEVETSHHLISIRLYIILTILITEDDHSHNFFLAIAAQLFFFIAYNKMKKIYITLSEQFQHSIEKSQKYVNSISLTHIYMTPPGLVQVHQ
jgi:hypothetical protein